MFHAQNKVKFYTYTISVGYVFATACNGLAGPYITTVYSASPTFTGSTRFFTNSGLTTAYNGASLYYGDSTQYAGSTVQIDANGYNILVIHC